MPDVAYRQLRFGHSSVLILLCVSASLRLVSFLASGHVYHISPTTFLAIQNAPSNVTNTAITAGWLHNCKRRTDGGGSSNCASHFTISETFWFAITWPRLTLAISSRT